MSAIASDWLESMVTVSWEFLLLALVAWLVDVALLRKASAALRHAMWGLVLLRLLVPVSLDTPLAQAPAVPGWATAEAVWALPVGGEEPREARPVLSRAAAAPLAAPSPAADSFSFAPPALDLPSVLLVAWLVFVLLLAYRQHRRRRRSRREIHPPDERMRELSTRAAERVGLRRSPEVLVAPALPEGPSIEGALRPRVLLPESVCSWQEARLHAVLVHELVHVARRDPLVRAIANLIQIAYFFHPAVWLVGARLRSLRERAVDDRVVELLDEERTSYLHALLDFATTRATPRLEPALGMASRRSPLAARLKRLMGRDYRPTSPTWRSLTMISAFVLAATLLVGSGAAISNESTGASEAPKISMRAVYPTMHLTSSVDRIASAEKTTLDGDAEAGRWIEPSRPDLSALAADDSELVDELSGRTLRFRLLVDTEGAVHSAELETDGVAGPVRDALGAHARSLRFEPTRHKTLGAVPFEVLFDYTIDPPQRKLSLLDPEDELAGFEVVDVVRLLPAEGGPGRRGAAARIPYVRILGKGEPPELHGASLPADVSVAVVVDPGGAITGAELLRLHPRAGFEVPAEIEEDLVAWVSTFELEHSRDPDLDGLGFTGAVDLRVRDGAIAIASRATADRDTLATRFAEHYALPEGRVLDLRPPPHDRLRMDFYRFGSPGQAPSRPSRSMGASCSPSSSARSGSSRRETLRPRGAGVGAPARTRCASALRASPSA